MSNGKVIPTDLYDDDGNMIGIEFNDTSGKFVVEAGWDHRDKQTSENRVKFREWAYRFITKNLDYEVIK